MIVLIVILCVK